MQGFSTPHLCHCHNYVYGLFVKPKFIEELDQYWQFQNLTKFDLFKMNCGKIVIYYLGDQKMRVLRRMICRLRCRLYNVVINHYLSKAWLYLKREWKPGYFFKIQCILILNLPTKYHDCSSVYVWIVYRSIR